MKLEDFPMILTPKIEMKNPNENICIHPGTYTIKWKDKVFKSDGSLIFKWLPRLTVKFRGKLGSDFDYSWVEPFETDLIVEITSENPKINLKGGIYKIREKEEFNIVCSLSQQIEVGQKEINVEHVLFEIANLRSFYGRPVQTKNSGHRNRLIFENIESRITIDKYTNFMELRWNLNETGGYQLLYTGKLELKSNKKISFEKSSEILDTFSYFLLFINGRRCFPLFRSGIIDSNEVWSSYSPFLNDQYQHVYSWTSDSENNGLEGIWKDFSELWKNLDDRESMKTILHWYTEANSNSAFVEGSIVLIQNALELLFHWLISEKMKYVNVSEADNLSASAKIGFLLAFYNINPSLPAEFDSLPKFAKQNNILNGPESFTRIRNCIVHPNHKKRKALKEIESQAKSEALHLGIWYVEIILLKHLNFKGNYINRCKSLKYINHYEEIK
jgi:hypothetical protein